LGFLWPEGFGQGSKRCRERPGHKRAEIREGLDVGNLLSFYSAFTEGVEIPENVRVKCAIQWPF
jgi:hypothetical protein